MAIECTQCKRTLTMPNVDPAIVVRQCIAFDGVRPRIPSMQTFKQRIGPGTELKMLLTKLGIDSQPGCKCNQRAAVMDIEGPDWCERHLEEICDWMAEEANKRKLPFVRWAARMMVKRAISKARTKLKMLERE